MNSITLRTLTIQPASYRNCLWRTPSIHTGKKSRSKSRKQQNRSGSSLSPRHFDRCMRVVASASAKRLFDGNDISRRSVKGGDLRELKAALNEAVALEDYFLAAQLRDEIKELENKDPILNLKKMMEEAIKAEDYKVSN